MHKVHKVCGDAEGCRRMHEDPEGCRRIYKDAQLPTRCGCEAGAQLRGCVGTTQSQLGAGNTAQPSRP